MAHSALAGYVARRLRDPEASQAPADLAGLARLLRALASVRHDCGVPRVLTPTLKPYPNAHTFRLPLCLASYT